ncbi:hypothetical protein HMPREF2751_00300 [Corynebacterium sp. HMSC063G05]|nr:hypothetical protein HMPREF2751_00300 [Corynebacterium sp. HMSC063G05]
MASGGGLERLACLMGLAGLMGALEPLEPLSSPQFALPGLLPMAGIEKVTRFMTREYYSPSVFCHKPSH